MATKIVEVRNGGLKLFNGDYEYYLMKKEEERLEAEEAKEAALEATRLAAKRAKAKEKEREKGFKR